VCGSVPVCWGYMHDAREIVHQIRDDWNARAKLAVWLRSVR